MKLSFKIFCLTVYGHCLGSLTQEGVQKWLPDYYMSDSMFQPFNYVVVKQVIFMSLVEKSHKDIDVIQNDNSGGSKHTIPEIGQRSNECKLYNKCSIYHIISHNPGR